MSSSTKKNLSDTERQSIYQRLLQKSFNGKTKKGSICETAALFDVSPRTVRRIWHRAQHQVCHGVTVDVSSKMPKVVGRKKVQIDLTQVSQLPLSRRGNIHCLAKSIGVPKF